MFEDEKIDFIDSLPDKDTILILWVKLLTLAGKVNDRGLIYLTPEMPYTEEMLSHKFKRPINTVKLAFETFRRLGMIYIIDDSGHMAITNWEKHQNIESLSHIKEQNRIRKQAQRDRQKLIENKGKSSLSRDSHTDVTQQNKNKNKNKDNTSSKVFNDDVLRLSELLLNEILKNNPNSRLHACRDKELTTQRWAKDIDLLIRIDRQKPSIVEEVIRFVTADDFWRANILSGKKLREKWDTLITQMNRKGVSNPNPRAGKLEKDNADDDIIIDPSTGNPAKTIILSPKTRKTIQEKFKEMEEI